MICVGDCARGDIPGGVPAKLVFVNQQAHQLSYGDCRMRVIKLHGKLFMEVFRPPPSRPVHAEHILKGTRHKEELLLQPKHFPLRRFVVRVKDFRDVFRLHFLLDRAVVIALVERREVKRLDRLGFPQPKQIAGADLVAQDWSVVRFSFDDAVRDPAHPMMAMVVYPCLGVPSKTHVVDDLRAADFPWIAETQPFIRRLDLPTFFNGLFEDSEFVSDTITNGRYFEGSQRIHVTGRQPTKAAVSEPRFFLLFEQSVEVVAEFGYRLPHLICYAEVKQVKCDMGAGKIFCGEIGDSASLLALMALDGVYTMAEHSVTHCHRERCIEVVARRYGRHAAHAAKQVVYQRLLDILYAQPGARSAEPWCDGCDGRAAGLIIH